MKNILLLADTGHQAAAVQDHIAAILKYTTLRWFVENPLTHKILHKLDLSYFHAIGIHYSIKVNNDYYLPNRLKEKIKLFCGKKFIFLQDEYACVNKTITSLIELKIDILFTLIDENYRDEIYAHPQLNGLKKITILTGYVSDALGKIIPKPLKNRSLDIFYRSRTYPFSLGRLAQERVILAEGVKKRADQYHLTYDISLRESDRIYGQNWLNRLQSARAVLGTESGASIWDMKGDIAKKIKKLFYKYPEMDFEFASKLLLAQYESHIYYATISPRVFEAVATRTAMILFPGFYSGILKKDIHYISLNKDFSNFEEVVSKLKDDNFLKKVTDSAYEDLILSKKYDQKRLSELVEKELLELGENKLNNFFIERICINKKLALIKSNYFFLNCFLILLNELKFIVKNLFIICFDPQYKNREKLYVLNEGLKRYKNYLFMRFRKHKSDIS